MSKYTPIIGLEVHVELKTESKMFCSCSAEYFGKDPNTHTCPVCLGLPGALPVPNKTAIDWCMKIALALNCDISLFSKFDRKNYFYPDLAKGFQLSQYDLPFGLKGSMKLSTGKTIGITRVHMEEDTGKLTHTDGASLIDFNRSGVPLVEIVTEPDFSSEIEVKEYLQNLQQIVRYLGVSNADMEKGDMRLEPNMSLIPTEKYVFPMPLTQLPSYKVEVKNINSFRFVEKAIQYEFTRQAEILDTGEKPKQETRGWSEVKQVTVSQRSKEDAKDYRYFPEPDIPPIITTKEKVEELRSSLPELPTDKRERFMKEYELSFYDTEIITRDMSYATYFENIVIAGKDKDVSAKQIANALINKRVTSGVSPEEVISTILSLSQVATIDEGELERVIQEVISEQEKPVLDYKSGKEPVIMFLVGCVMRKLSVKPDAQLIKEKLISALQ